MFAEIEAERAGRQEAEAALAEARDTIQRLNRRAQAGEANRSRILTEAASYVASADMHVTNRPKLVTGILALLTPTPDKTP